MVLADYGQKAAEVLPNLERLLQDEEFIRVTAVHAVLCIAPGRTEELTPILAEALSSDDATVRQRAAQVLGDTPASGALAIHVLVKALDEEDESVRLTVLNTLNNLGSAAAPATPVLVQILTGSDDIIERGFAALALGSIGPAAGEAVPQLLTCLQEPGDTPARIYFRLKVAHAWWRISGQSDHLLAIASIAVRSPEWWLRWQGAGLLGELGVAGRAAIPQLRRLMEDQHQLVRRSAVESLGKIEAAE